MVVRTGQYNIAHICTTQQCDEGLSGKVAFRWIPASGDTLSFTFFDLDHHSADSTRKCNRWINSKKYLIWCFKSKAFSGAIV